MLPDTTTVSQGPKGPQRWTDMDGAILSSEDSTTVWKHTQGLSHPPGLPSHLTASETLPMCLLAQGASKC